MDRTSLALTIAFVTVGVVLFGVWAVAHFGERAMLRPPSQRALRRVAVVMAGLGGVQLLYGIARGLLTRDVGGSLWSLFNGVLLLAIGRQMWQEHRVTD